MTLRRLLAVAAPGLLGGCGLGRWAGPGGAASAAPCVSVSASATPIPSTIPSAAGPEAAPDPDEETLRRSRLAGLAPLHGPGARAGVFEAALDAPGGRREAIAEPATVAAPTAYRVPLAFYRLARALGIRVVPVTVVRAIPLGELGGALEPRGGGLPVLRGLRVQNDGTVDVLLATRASASAGSPWEAPRGALVAVDAGPEVSAWDRWASAAEPAPGEDGALLRDYVEMRVLDYLAANLARRTTLRSGRALVLADNAAAFSPHPDGPTLDAMLRRLRAVARFPRGLRDALARFDRARAAAAFAEGGFETWLLPPRVLVELDERRAALLTLLEARVADRGAAAVLAL